MQIPVQQTWDGPEFLHFLETAVGANAVGPQTPLCLARSQNTGAPSGVHGPLQSENDLLASCDK